MITGEITKPTSIIEEITRKSPDVLSSEELDSALANLATKTEVLIGITQGKAILKYNENTVVVNTSFSIEKNTWENQVTVSSKDMYMRFVVEKRKVEDEYVTVDSYLSSGELSRIEFKNPFIYMNARMDQVIEYAKEKKREQARANSIRNTLIRKGITSQTTLREAINLGLGMHAAILA